MLTPFYKPPKGKSWKYGPGSAHWFTAAAVSSRAAEGRTLALTSALAVERSMVVTSGCCTFLKSESSKKDGDTPIRGSEPLTATTMAPQVRFDSREHTNSFCTVKHQNQVIKSATVTFLSYINLHMHCRSNFF